jgi:hypothetical protein
MFFDKKTNLNCFAAETICTDEMIVVTVSCEIYKSHPPIKTLSFQKLKRTLVLFK